ncbi:MAG: hypothetical protein PHF84_01610, partial [bacterium]|nr:hypothetical protein [bacterium]
IIMFKPCYPGSAVSGYDTKYDATTGNNGYGNVISGTPYADNSTNNFLYLNSTASVDTAYGTDKWSQGTWNSAGSSLAQLKCAYRGMLNIFAQHPDILFIALSAPPMKSLTLSQASNNRRLAQWFREDWLHQYDPTGKDKFQDYPLNNVVPFDFENSIGRTANDPVLDNRYYWFVRGGFPDDTLDPSNISAARDVGEQNGYIGDDHPDAWLNQRTSIIFCGGKDTYSTNNTGMVQRTYDAWIHAAVNRWLKGPSSPSTPSVTTNRQTLLPKEKDIACYPTLINLNNTTAARIVVPSLADSSATIRIMNMRGTVIREITGARFNNGIFQWTISQTDRQVLTTGTLIIQVGRLKTFIMIVR